MSVAEIRTLAVPAKSNARRLTSFLGLAALSGCAGGDIDASGRSTATEISERNQSIVGGNQAVSGAWPTVVSVRYDFSPVYPFWCGGTLISPTQVLTAAHCVFNDLTSSRYDVIIGRHDLTTTAGQAIAVTGITVHPDYSFIGDDNDIAVLQLASAVPAGTRFQRLVAPGRMSEIRAGDDATALGWGDTSEGGSPSNTLQIVTVDVIGRGDACEAVSDYSEVTANEICIGDLAGGRDTCQGDSGGPMFVRRDNEWFQLGVTSWGFGCARPDLPGVYTFVPNYLDWVRSVAPTAPAPSLLPSSLISVVTR